MLKFFSEAIVPELAVRCWESFAKIAVALQWKVQMIKNTRVNLTVFFLLAQIKWLLFKGAQEVDSLNMTDGSADSLFFH